MDFTNDFFIQAQGVIERTFRAERDKLLQASGNVATELKSDNTIVTELDKALEKKLRAELHDFDNAIGIEGEEYGIEGNRKTYWLLDPIDGTDAFVRGLPYYRNVVTLMDDGKPVFTLIYKPAPDELFVAAVGEGAYKNGRQIQLKKRSLAQARIEVSVPTQDPEEWRILQQIVPHINSLKIVGDFTSIAEGKLDGYFVYNGQGGPWDYAPRALLLAEAGAHVTNIGSDLYDVTINNLLAVHPDNYVELMDIILKARDTHGS